MDVEILDPDRADLEELARLRRLSYRGVAGTSAFDAVFEPLLAAEYQSHKYHPPAGKARIAVVRERGTLLAMNAMIPETLRHAEGTPRGWQSCDTATHPDARGRGLFTACLKALRSELADGDVFFGFPNASSSPGFSKLFKPRAVLDVYVNPLPARAIDSGFGGVTRFDPVDDELTRTAAVAGDVMIDRSAAYLNWRYLSRPGSPYAAFTFRAGARARGLAVARIVASRWGTFCLVMELIGESREVEAALLRGVAAWGCSTPRRPLLFVSTAWGSRTWLRRGMWRVPRPLLPRKLVLMAGGGSSAAEAIAGLDWRADIGDWDVF